MRHGPGVGVCVTATSDVCGRVAPGAALLARQRAQLFDQDVSREPRVRVERGNLGLASRED
eukprot:scaffold86_cov75-Phaeocystis_antarctica.AAC.3